ncbi:CblZ, a non-orthologous displasment for Alpha-ribazole-5'-phosphate phosphatase [Alloactinosynnema sp. L-07]|nr:CblZ, a non-orthologous displasment for Alpha-ribazole-5'-phosphate phosphatase [Alloactinosynnema sp. L-07]
MGEDVPKGHTPGKGRPTPKRREAEGRKRGPVPPPPKTSREAMRRARGSKEERKALAAKRKDQRVEQRQRMLSGDEKYLMPRDRGPVKAYVRDLVDGKRNLLGLFMPLALLVVMSMFVQNFAIQQYATLASLVMLILMIIEGVINGRRFTRLARAKFPKENIRGASVGWYAFVRASQIRKLRAPKPRVSPGDKV